jgi:hypothetical protein
MTHFTGCKIVYSRPSNGKLEHFLYDLTGMENMSNNSFLLLHLRIALCGSRKETQAWMHDKQDLLE